MVQRWPLLPVVLLLKCWWNWLTTPSSEGGQQLISLHSMQQLDSLRIWKSHKTSKPPPGKNLQQTRFSSYCQPYWFAFSGCMCNTKSHRRTGSRTKAKWVGYGQLRLFLHIGVLCLFTPNVELPIRCKYWLSKTAQGGNESISFSKLPPRKASNATAERSRWRRLRFSTRVQWWVDITVRMHTPVLISTNYNSLQVVTFELCAWVSMTLYKALCGDNFFAVIYDSPFTCSYFSDATENTLIHFIYFGAPASPATLRVRGETAISFFSFLRLRQQGIGGGVGYFLRTAVLRLWLYCSSRTSSATVEIPR